MQKIEITNRISGNKLHIKYQRLIDPSVHFIYKLNYFLINPKKFQNKKVFDKRL
ncbi:hypothetical protein KIS1582_0358 [Cytobacillus firmus]|uniref:Uncharacterized protein n=1 Tax=Cytobacillus firmus TaxID=1399 RepID=A0A800NFI0_CYTFI|nr:hypothetical protein KIS1582_0358 [Cytobacillus firmus]